MRRWMIALTVCGLVASAFVGTTHAQYRDRPAAAARGSRTTALGPAAATTARPSPSEDDFDRAVDLTRFRRGNVDWDTQELIKSGLTALHREHTRILSDLATLRAEVERLSGEVRRGPAGQQP